MCSTRPGETGLKSICVYPQEADSVTGKTALKYDQKYLEVMSRCIRAYPLFGGAGRVEGTQFWIPYMPPERAQLYSVGKIFKTNKEDG